MRSIIGLNPDPMVIHTEGYQVWSTVLGASLTTVDTIGNKRHTKVFAGGAHIATQDANATTSTGDDRILFTSADPVTGTTARFDYTGGTSQIIREDTEPLGGQQIERNDPGTGYPADYGQVFGTPRDSEWQCMIPKEFYGGFGGLPVHCKMAAMEGKNFDRNKAFVDWDVEENPKKVAQLVDSPLLRMNIPGGGMPSDNALAFAAKSTNKPSKEDKIHEGGELGTVLSEPWTDPTDAISAEYGNEDGFDAIAMAFDGCNLHVVLGDTVDGKERLRTFSFKAVSGKANSPNTNPLLKNGPIPDGQYSFQLSEVQYRYQKGFFGGYDIPSWAENKPIKGTTTGEADAYGDYRVPLTVEKYDKEPLMTRYGYYLHGSQNGNGFGSNGCIDLGTSTVCNGVIGALYDYYQATEQNLKVSLRVKRTCDPFKSKNQE